MQTPDVFTLYVDFRGLRFLYLQVCPVRSSVQARSVFSGGTRDEG